MLEKELQYEARERWLQEGGASERDVLSDDLGEYVMSLNDFTDGTPCGKDCSWYTKLYLPQEYQNLFVNA